MISPEKAALMGRAGHLVSRWQDAVQLYDQKVGACEGLSQTERHCIALLVQGPVSPHQIASAVHMTRAAVTSLLDRLERRGLLTRSPDLQDRRKLQALLAAMSGADLQAMCRFLDGALLLQDGVTAALR